MTWANIQCSFQMYFYRTYVIASARCEALARRQDGQSAVLKHCLAKSRGDCFVEKFTLLATTQKTGQGDSRGRWKCQVKQPCSAPEWFQAEREA